MNIIQIAGHLGADPDTRFTPSGQKVTTFNVATKVWKGGKEETIWFRITVWGDRFDKMLAHMKKGSAVIVAGELAPARMWTDKEGRTQVSLEITADIIKFSPFGKPEQRAGGQEQEGYGQAHKAPAAPAQGHQGGFGEQSFGSSAHGSNPFAGNAASGYGDAFPEEEKIPF